jgi:hypothetical protein
MQIKPQHHMSILQRQDRILTGNFDMRILDYQEDAASHETLVQTNGVDIAINYRPFTPLLNPRVLAAGNGANVHALAHNLRTPRMEAHMLDAFKNNGPMWRQAFNIAEDWRVECHIVDDSHIAGPMLASMFTHVTNVLRGQLNDRDVFILTAGRLYLADASLVGDKHVEYMRALRDLAAHEESITVAMRFLDHQQNGGVITTAERKIFDKHEDLHYLQGTAWANAVIEHAILYHDKLWSMKHLGHPVNDTYLLGSQMCEIIERIMVLIGPGSRDNGTSPAFDVWQDVTFLFDQTGGDGSPTPSPGDGSPPPPGDAPPSDGGDGDDEGDGEGSKGRGGSFGDGMFNEDCRCGTCGR